MASLDYKHKGIYVRFRYNGKHYNKRTHLECYNGYKPGCHCRGCRAAERLAIDIQQAIDYNRFDFDNYFEQKQKATAKPNQSIGFFEYALEHIYLIGHACRRRGFGLGFKDVRSFRLKGNTGALWEMVCAKRSKSRRKLR